MFRTPSTPKKRRLLELELAERQWSEHKKWPELSRGQFQPFGREGAPPARGLMAETHWRGAPVSSVHFCRRSGHSSGVSLFSKIKFSEKRKPDPEEKGTEMSHLGRLGAGIGRRAIRSPPPKSVSSAQGSWKRQKKLENMDKKERKCARRL